MTSTGLGMKEWQYTMCPRYGHNGTFSRALVLFRLIAILREDKYIVIIISFHSMKTKAQTGEAIFSVCMQSL